MERKPKFRVAPAHLSDGRAVETSISQVEAKKAVLYGSHSETLSRFDVMPSRGSQVDESGVHEGEGR